MDADPTPPPSGDGERHHEAVRLRAAGLPLEEIRRRTGLSVPTIVSAHKRFLAGGWEAVAGRARGRRSGEGRKLDAAQEAEVFHHLTRAAPDALGLAHRLWSTAAVQAWIERIAGAPLTPRSVSNYLARWQLAAPRPSARLAGATGALASWRDQVYPTIAARAEQERAALYWVDEVQLPGPVQPPVPAATPPRLLRAVTPRGKLFWLGYGGSLQARLLNDFFARLLDSTEGKAFVVLDGMRWDRAAVLSEWLAAHSERLLTFHVPDAGQPAEGVDPSDPVAATAGSGAAAGDSPSTGLTVFGQQLQHLVRATFAADTPSASQADPFTAHLSQLEAESIHILREVVAECERPVMLYSAGKDSTVMLHLALKAFYPAKPPFPLLHIDTTWKFRELLAYRDRAARDAGMELIVHSNADGLQQGINPFTHGSSIHTDIMKTQALKQTLEEHRFDAAFGGGRRDEEKSRAKERICSLRSATQRWDPKRQRPEPWQLLNTRMQPGESLRVFPLSNWTELDIWQYVRQQRIALPALYFARPRPVVERDGAWIVVDDHRLPLRPGELPVMRSVRFRTLGCYPLTAAMPSRADSVEAVIAEMLAAPSAERQGRVIDQDSPASMEKKKQEGYF